MMFQEDVEMWARRFRNRFGVDLDNDFGKNWVNELSFVDMKEIWNCMIDNEINEGLGL